MTTQTPQSFSPSGTGGDPAVHAESGSARDRAAHVGEIAKDQAASVAQEAEYQARDVVQEARQQVLEQVAEQRGRLGDLLRDVSDELEQMAASSDRNGVAADVMRQIAARARDARGYLGGDNSVMDDVRRFARRRPGVFLLGAVAAGALTGRATRAAAASRRSAGSSAAGYPAQDDPGTGTYPGTTPSGYATPTSGYATGAGTAAGEAGVPGYPEPDATEPYPAAPLREHPAPPEAGTRTEQRPGGTVPPEREEHR